MGVVSARWLCLDKRQGSVEVLECRSIGHHPGHVLPRMAGSSMGVDFYASGKEDSRS